MRVNIILPLVLSFLFTLNCSAQPGFPCWYPITEAVNKFDTSPAAYDRLTKLSDSLHYVDYTKLGDCAVKTSFWESYARCELLLASRPGQKPDIQLQYINSAFRTAQKGYSLAKQGSSVQDGLLDICIDAQRAKAGLIYSSEQKDTMQYASILKTLDSLQLLRQPYKIRAQLTNPDSADNIFQATDTVTPKSNQSKDIKPVQVIALNEILMRVGFLFYRNRNYVSDTCLITATIIEGPDRVGQQILFPSKPAGELLLTHFSNYRIRFSAPGYADQYRWLVTDGTTSNQFNIFSSRKGQIITTIIIRRYPGNPIQC